MYCRYFIAKVKREKTWLLTGLLKNECSIVFERALDPKEGVFEFFVPESQVPRFLDFIGAIEGLGLLIGPVLERPNRILETLLQ